MSKQYTARYSELIEQWNIIGPKVDIYVDCSEAGAKEIVQALENAFELGESIGRNW